MSDRMRQRAGWCGPLLRASAVIFVALALPASASADWLVTPFVGTTLGGSSNLLTLDPSSGNKKFTFGASFGWLSDGVLGVEASASHTPHFFESGSGSLVVTSGVSTLTGDVVAAVPQSITGYSLRPYLVAGVGLLHANSRDVIQFPDTTFDSNLLALNLGGGAIGMLSNRTGLRFEIRQYRNLSADTSATTTSGRSTRISFWRASIGVVLRY
jgi:hypothetical protein